MIEGVRSYKLELDQSRHTTVCGFCGWFEEGADFSDLSGAGSWTASASLIQLDSNDAELSLRELQDAILADPTKVTAVHPRRFELLIADVYRNTGFSVEVTKTTRDGGRDLIIMRGGGDDCAIVEVKRRKQRVGVDLVRQLRGVQMRDDAPNAILVSAVGFTQDARLEAAAQNPRSYGFNFELVDALDLLKSLDLLREPGMSPRRLSRSRDDYRRWVRRAFPARLKGRRHFASLEGHTLRAAGGRGIVVRDLNLIGDAVLVRWPDGATTWESKDRTRRFNPPSTGDLDR